MELKPGYKQTEVGVIPDDWGVRCLGDLGKLEMGKGLLKDDISPQGEIPAIPYTSLYTDFSEVIDSGRIKWFAAEQAAPYIVNSPCVLFASSSNVSANTGKACALIDGFPTAVGREVISLNTKQNVVFISYLLGTRNYRKKTLDLAKGITIKHVYPTTFVKYAIAVPSISEQSAIAEALGDVDALLSSLDTLIAKKRDLKQAAMQQLLTGKTRLPGFKGEWAVTRLGDHATLIRNGVYSRAELSIDGSIKYLHYGDIHTSGAVHLNPSEAIMPFLRADKAVRLGRLVSGDLVFVDATEDLAGVGKSVEVVGAEGTEVVAGLHTIAVRFDKRILADGFKAYLQFIPAFGAHLRSLAAGTKVLSTNRSHIASAEIALPSIAEQAAIAQVLSDMDAELAALQARRDKTRLLKQGMMQELLTGKTRLV
ncbi:hypothetical protein C7H84_25290 [Burkholderia sp. Nafp2/4-1b]|uniref:restriction endonuclease subunit S n=1 Tax=Burkholderia sp. Nafp2/4-1b TaxID=2116686 RepID=UPI000EF85CE5|nr:restriction endonuclease subunit S [Burkholderia sp. Nafp2/4-1b]RKU00967.1 hypothetical protein C7H84_25290 [Burkholderia sp. Nafp2/4-1b]